MKLWICIQQAIETYPAYYEAYYARAVIFYEQAEYASAIADMNAYIGGKPWGYQRILAAGIMRIR